MLAESLLRLDQMIDRQNKTTEEMYGLRTNVDSRFERMDKRFERLDSRFEQVEGILERLAVGFNEFVDIHRQMVKA